jgi:peptidoglycan biosynthesis protein MviN/MurJ (putative lipid II flippase)
VSNAYARVKVPSRVNLAAAVLNVLLILILGKALALKLFGVAIAAMTSKMLSAALFRSWYACKISGMPLRKYWQEAVVKPLGWAGVLTVSVLAVVAGVQGNLRLSPVVFITLTPAMLIYYGGAYVFIFNSAEKKHIREVFELLLLRPRTMLAEDNIP